MKHEKLNFAPSISFFFCLILSLNLQSVNAQEFFTGEVLAEDDVPIHYANVVAMSMPDSSYISGTVTDEHGAFKILKSEDVNLLKVSYIGYEDTYIRIENKRLNYSITMNSSSYHLDEMVIKGRKAIYELKQDRMVMNVSASPSLSGNSALQVLQKAPGVIVDRQNNSVSLGSKGSVLIMINNKIQRVPQEVLMARLEGMQAESIERIELIHQPSARYDADGAAGIIHIVLKENAMEGFSGNASLIAGYGQKEKLGLNIGINTRKDKLNWYADYTYNWSPMTRFDVNHFREYDYQDDVYYYENLVSLQDATFGQHAFNMGLDIHLSSKTIIGFLSNFSHGYSIFDSRAISNDFVNRIQRNSFGFQLDPKTVTNSAIGNINIFHELSSKSNLNLDLDYARIDIENIGDIESTSMSSTENIRASRNTPIDIWTIKLDNSNQLSEKTKLELGTKFTLSDIVSSSTVADLNNEEWLGNNLFTGTDNIKENIIAAYASLNHQFSDKMNGEFGLRFEHYNFNVDAANPENDLKQIFNNLFPIVRFNYDMDSVNTLQLSFNRTITRPTFRDLASYFVFLDPSILVYGNPQLRPTFTNNLKLSWQHRSVIVSAAYIRTVNQIYYYNTVDKPNHIQTSVVNNLDLNEIFEATITFPLYLTDWWEMNGNLSLMHHNVRDDSQRELPFRNNIISYSGQINSSFNWGSGWSASVDGRYMSDYIYGDQEQFLYPSLNVGLRKKFYSGTSLSVSVQDLTDTSGKIKWEYHQPELGIRTFGNNNWSERQIRFTLAFPFGNKKLKDKRQRNSGEDAKSRM